MLKKELRETVQTMEDQLLDNEATIRDQRGIISELRDRQSEYNKLLKNVDRAKTSIAALVVVNCADQIEWENNYSHIGPHELLSGDSIPDAPLRTELYTSLRHIEQILNRQITEEKKDSRFGY